MDWHRRQARRHRWAPIQSGFHEPGVTDHRVKVRCVLGNPLFTPCKRHAGTQHLHPQPLLVEELFQSSLNVTLVRVLYVPQTFLRLALSVLTRSRQRQVFHRPPPTPDLEKTSEQPH